MVPNASAQPRFRAQRENVAWSALLGVNIRSVWLKNVMPALRAGAGRYDDVGAMA